MSLLKLWATNIIYEPIAPEVTQEFLTDLINIGFEYEASRPEAHVPVAMRKSPEVSYNLLLDDRESCQKFKQMLKSRMIEMAKAENFYDPENVEFEATTALRKFGPGEFAKTHVHRSVDYVAVLWCHIDVTDFPGNNTHQKPAGSRLHIIDPIAMRSRFLNHSVMHEVSPVPGTFLIHPSYLFHTSEINLGRVDTIALVTNIKVKETVRNYATL
jgi:hypothetical protein